MRSILLVLCLAACGGNSNTDRCQKLKDSALATERKKIDDSVASVDPKQRDEIRAQGDKELARFAERFVDVCKGLDDATIKCIEQSDHPDAACKEKLRPALDKLYR